MRAPELARLRAGPPAALFISARRSPGRAELVAAIAARLGMDAERMRLELDARHEADRRLRAELYRHATVVSHESSGARVAIEADVPRRLMARFRRAKVPA